ncbi:MAG: dTDP-4-dehydrorhamnose 3,5-epimerase family protein [Leptospiraceae bacterium]|nr:dTDP-4-dehydrorhamnose 3,5-epimerase family protein [Leptospiraceae bacterium]
MKFDFIETGFAELYLVCRKYNSDNRGSFSRVFCKEDLKDLNFKEIKQINHSITKEKGSFRGFHLQIPPKAEMKMVSCFKGKVLDIVIDLRKDSKTFLKSFSTELSENNSKSLIIPEGFAHGFQTLEENSELIYFHTEFYNPGYEMGVNFSDPEISIDLPLQITEISDKDKNLPFLDKNFKGIEI